MDIIFNCPKCDVELAVDASGAGSEINCPECNEPIRIPEAPAGTPPAPPPPPRPTSGPMPVIASPSPPHGGPVNAMAASAAAKIEHHFSVPVSNKPVQQLVARAIKPVEIAARGGEKRVRVKSIRHSDCIEVGHDRFDEIVSNFLSGVGETNIVTIAPFTYTHTEHGGDRLVTDYGVLITYKG